MKEVTSSNKQLQTLFYSQFHNKLTKAIICDIKMAYAKFGCYPGC